MIDWSIERIARLTELATDPEGLSESKIGATMTDEFGTEFTRNAVHHKMARLDLRSLLSKPVTNVMPYYAKYRHIIEGNMDVPKLHKFDDDKRGITSIVSPRTKILYLGDLHIPFQLDDQIQMAVNRNSSAQIVVTNEVMDCHSLSRFNKSISVPFEVELDNTVRYFEFLSDKFGLVFVIGGNHENRVSKEVMRQIPPSLLFLVKTNVLEMLARPFPNIIIVPGPYLQINDAIFTHAEFFSKVDLKAATNVYGFLQEWRQVLGINDFRLIVQAHCLSDDTEILTRNGWKTHDQIANGDEVLTLNTSTDKLEYNSINEIYKYDHYKEMLSFKGRNALDLLVTPDHRMIYKNIKGKYGECKAKDFKKGRIIPCAGKIDGEQVPYSDDFLRFLGFFIADGGFTSDDCSGVRLYQKWSDRSFVENMLGGLGYEYSLYRKSIEGRKVGKYESTDDEAIFYIKAKHVKQLHNLLLGQKDIPRKLMNISGDQFLSLLDGLMLGDGTYYPKKNGGQYYTSNESLVNNLQELCTKNGLRTSLRSVDKFTDGIRRKIRYILTWLDRDSCHYENEVETVPYDGIAWCVNVDNGTIVVRRNGRPAIVGNTHMLGSTYRAGHVKIMEGGCMCKVPDYAVDRWYSKPQTNGYITVVQKEGITDFNLTREYSFGTEEYDPEWSISECTASLATAQNVL